MQFKSKFKFEYNTIMKSSIATSLSSLLSTLTVVVAIVISTSTATATNSASASHNNQHSSLRRRGLIVFDDISNVTESSESELELESESLLGLEQQQLKREPRIIDQIFLYCIDSNGNDRPLTGISYNGPFMHTATSNFIEFGTNTSSAPDYLLNNTFSNNTGTLVMPSSSSSATYLNWQYIGPMTGLNFHELREAIQDTTNNWIGTNPDGTTSASASSSTTIMSVLIMTMMTATLTIRAYL